MKKKPASKSAFFDQRVLIGFVLCSIGVFLTLLGSGAFSSTFAQAKIPAPDAAAPLLEETEQLSPADNNGRFVQLIEFAEPGLLRRQGHTSGEHFRADTPQARADLEQLKTEQAAHVEAIASAIGRQPVVTHHFTVTHSGIATRLTPEEAQIVRMMPGVVSVERERVYEMDTFRSPFFIGADKIWDGTAVPGGVGTRGQGVVIAGLDSGLVPTHPSFVNDAACGHGVSGAPNKLLSVLDCATATGPGGLCNGPAPNDTDGHGSHTNSTSGGNTVPLSAVPPPAAIIQGVAPCANIRSYKVCPGTSCPGADIQAGMNSVLLHGDVDVMNFSIAGGDTPWSDNDRRKLDLVNAGVVVSASAGNTSGTIPNPVGNVGHRGPWVMTVAASTKDAGGPGTGDILANFSLRGPIAGTLQDLTKPDVTGPGVNIYAAVLGNYGTISGTSMSSPHLAGSAALVRAVHPTWLPSEVKSALMMTSFNGGFKENGTTPWDPDDVGTGRVDLTKVALAGLVMNETFNNFLAANPATGGDPKTLNVPSVRDMNCTPTCVWTRTVRNTKTVPTSWTATGSAITPGFTVNVVPPTFNFTGNVTETQVLTITATPIVTLTGAVAFGQVLLTETGAVSPNERITVAIKGVPAGPTPTPPPTPTLTPPPPPTPTSTPSPSGTPSPSPCGPIIFAQNFDGVVAPGLPPGWTSTINAGDPPAWVTTTNTPDTPPNCAFVNDQDGISDKVLDSPTITIPTASAQLSFRNFYNTEYDPPPQEVFWDGGVLEVSISGAPFLDVTDPAIGGSFVTGGYTGEIDGTANNPLAGRMAWSGDSGGYINTVINFGANVSGQSIRLRFRMGTDLVVAAPGWRVDTIVMTTGPCPSPTPTPSPTVTPATPTPTPTVTPPTPTPTPTVTPATPTPTPTPTPTLTPTPTATPTPSPAPATQAINLSTRLRVQTGDRIGIGGFIITGSVPKHVLLRAIGPTLGNFGLSGVLADPVLELHGPGAFATVVNNNWRDTQEAQIQATGLAPTNDFESAIDATLVPGAYTTIVRGIDNTSGLGLVEIYDVGQGVASRVDNLSTRAFVSTGDNIVIAGFLLGNNTGDTGIIVRGLGPSLTPFGVPTVLADPTLELRDCNGTLIISNNDWQDNPAQAAEITAAGLAPNNNLEAAIAATLPPGPYTVQFFGLNNGTGIGLIEVYDRGNVGGAPVPPQRPPCAPSPAPATPTPTPTASPTGFCTENFDGVTPPALPAGWVATNATGPDPLWVTSSTTPDTAPNEAVVKDPPEISDKRLETRNIAITSASAQLSFRNNFNLQDGFDGGVLEVSSPNIAGGAFTDITNAAVGGSFVTGGYTDTISTAFASPIAGRLAWSGNSGGYISTVVNLGPNVNGRTIRLRFRLGTDQALAVGGWRIDTISIVGASCP